MARISDMRSVYEAEIALVKRQSSLLLQKRAGGFGGELRSSGAIVENYIKGFLAKNISGGYRICSGYIATANSISDDSNLIQHDIIIADNRRPTLHHFGIGDIEIVPAEAVCGIIEVKRTINQESVKSAVEHLLTTRRVLDEYNDACKSKVNTMNNLAGPDLSIATAAPLYGIVGLASDMGDGSCNFISTYINDSVKDFIDIIWSLSDSWLARFVVADSKGEIFVPAHVSRHQGEYSCRCQLDRSPPMPEGQVYGIGVSCLREWIRSTSGISVKFASHMKYFGAI